jgi:phosphoglucomutase
MNATEILKRAKVGFAEMAVGEDLRGGAIKNLERWLGDAEFQDTIPQLSYLVESGDFGALFDAYFRQIPFGTGGRRGPVGYGVNRFNRFTLQTSIQGHSQFLRELFPNDELSVVVAYDVRQFEDIRGVYDRERPHPLLGLSSKNFAESAACVYAANGINVWLPDPKSGFCISTPELSFSILHLKAFGGLNVSASHNHPDDNGAKIYNNRGGQEVPPIDEKLATIVEAITTSKTMAFDDAVEQGRIRFLSGEVHEKYVAMNAKIPANRDRRSARVVFTPLHGTGFESAGAALKASGFEVELYAPQGTADGGFPEVPFRSPNPEVPQSLEGARDYAIERGADLVLGTDPDADRLGMMAPHQGEWVFFTGNEIGVVLIDYLLHHAGREFKKPPFAITTVVTTTLFSRIAEASNCRVLADLGVGFKYIADVLNHIETSGAFGDLNGSIEEFLIAIEESHGYLVVSSVRDKDAAGAAVLLAEAASFLKDNGMSFVDYLDAIYRKFGYVRNRLVSTVMQGAQGFLRMRKIQESLRQEPPGEIAGREVVEVTDRWDESGRWGKIQSETDRLSRDLITFRLEGGARLTLRPSGTESKNKIYVEVCGDPLGENATDGQLAAEKERLDRESGEVALGFTREMLGRIGVSLPDYALQVSDLVALECKLDFAQSFLPELVEKLSDGGCTDGTEAWVDERLASYGSDAKLLVREAVRCYLDTEDLASEVTAGLTEIFSLAVC